MPSSQLEIMARFVNQQKAKTSFVFRPLVFVAASLLFHRHFSPFPLLAASLSLSPIPSPFPPFWAAICGQRDLGVSVLNESFQCSMLTHLHVLIKKFRVRPRDRHQLAGQGPAGAKKQHTEGTIYEKGARKGAIFRESKYLLPATSYQLPAPSIICLRS